MELFTPERAVEALRDGEHADLLETPGGLAAIAIEIPRRPIEAILPELLSRVPGVAIGIATTSPLPPPPSGFDLLLTDRPKAARPWVACPEGLDSSLARLESTIRSCPQASVSYVQVLRAGRQLDLPSALLLESFAFSTLLSGPEFETWLSSRELPPRTVSDSDPPVKLRRRDDTLEIILCRPDVHNAFNAAMRDTLVEALDIARHDASIEAVHLRGAGPSFSSGGDLREFGTAPDPSTAHLIRTIRNPVLALDRCAAPVTAFVHGACIGAGLELAARADRVIAHPDTAFALPEIGMGVLPGAGGTATIPRRIGTARTAYLALSRVAVGVDTAREWGLVDAISRDPFP
jgi:enoyl-CoA hydratase/carnithine racemase